MSKEKFTPVLPTSFTLHRAADLAAQGKQASYNVIGWQVGETLELSIFQSTADPATANWSGGSMDAGIRCETIVNRPGSVALTNLVEYMTAIRAHLIGLGFERPAVDICLNIHPGVVPF
jgi:hypothetical protein